MSLIRACFKSRRLRWLAAVTTALLTALAIADFCMEYIGVPDVIRRCFERKARQYGYALTLSSLRAGLWSRYAAIPRLTRPAQNLPDVLLPRRTSVCHTGCGSDSRTPAVSRIRRGRRPGPSAHLQCRCLHFRRSRTPPRQQSLRLAQRHPLHHARNRPQSALLLRYEMARQLSFGTGKNGGAQARRATLRSAGKSVCGIRPGNPASHAPQSTPGSPRNLFPGILRSPRMLT